MVIINTKDDKLFSLQFLYLQCLLQKFSSTAWLKKNPCIFWSTSHCSVQLHYTGGLNCIALHWHVSGGMSTCEMWPPLPFVRPYVHQFVCTSLFSSVCLPLPNEIRQNKSKIFNRHWPPHAFVQFKNAFLGRFVSRFVSKTCSPTTLKANQIQMLHIYIVIKCYHLVWICNPMICRISVCEKYNIQAQIQKTNKYTSVDFFWQMKKRVIWFFFGKYKFICINFFRPIQINIYFGVPKLCQCEYNYDNSDWYLKKIKMWIHFTQLYACEYKCYKSMQINTHMCHSI